MIDDINTLPRYWLVRLYLALSVVIFTGTALYQPDTQIYRMISLSGGQFFVFALMLLSLIAMLDAVVNDMFPDRYRLKWAMRHRHVIYMMIALGTFSMAYILWSLSGRPNGAALHLILSSAMATTIAFLDVFARHRP